ncbi:fumarylacetoacetate hydrolase family protein [Yunchengibacter salinarum]|uniref:fumarylacetoacetate hydrolase family protein n=1 Tax=Yunchengibacter salinarum TaxID=3133399 RepID=UPI0035B6003D
MFLARLKTASGDRLCLVDPTDEPGAGRYLPAATLDLMLGDDLPGFLARADWDRLVARARRTGGWAPMRQTRFLPPLGLSSRVFCVGKNYKEHAEELADVGSPHSTEAPDIFLRLPQSFTGHGTALRFPSGESSFDFEAELAVVIGRGGSRITADQAPRHIFGYAPANDGSLRRLQKRTSQFTLGKNFDRSGALGPVIAPRQYLLDAGLDPSDLGVRSRVNGRIMQDGRTSQMSFPVERLIAVLSAVTALLPGDIILTGTPKGVGAGRTPPHFLGDGDRLDVEIEGLPRLSCLVSAVKTPIL